MESVDHQREATEGKKEPTQEMRLDAALKKQISSKIPSFSFKKIQPYKKYIYGVLGAGVLYALFFTGGSSAPQTYGICATFLELQTPYPHTLDFIGAEGSTTTMRIYFTSTDPFGQYKQEMIECRFAASRGLIAVERNRRPVDAAEIQRFNKLLPALPYKEMNLVLPPKWKNPLSVE